MTRARNRGYRTPQAFWTFRGLACSVGVMALLVLIDIPIYPALLVGTSLMLFLFYGIDKRRAISGGRRIPETVLHGFALIGGFPGGWAGRSMFRHKTRKPAFAIVLAFATLLHIGLFVFMRSF